MVFCGNSSVGRAQPCQGRGREFESRFPLDLSMSANKTIKIGDQLHNISTKITLVENTPIFINFFATWCGPCVRELPDIQKLYNKYKDKIQFIFIHCGGNVNEVTTFIKQNGFSFPVVVDDDNSLTQQFNVLSIPLTIITDDNTIVKNIIVGACSYEDYEQEVTKLL